MESRFPQRVALERKVLDLVNASPRISSPLVGLANITVDSWLRSLPNTISDDQLATLTRALRLAAEAARSEADLSDEIFVDIDDAEVDVAISYLKAALTWL